VKILLEKKTIFTDFVERPQEASTMSCKKKIFLERLKRKAGLATNYQFLLEQLPI
jgi:hypothetical protein